MLTCVPLSSLPLFPLKSSENELAMAVVPFTFLQEHKGNNTTPALASHLSYHTSPTQAFAHLHCELPRIQPQHITPPLCVCVFHFSFKINSLIFEGQILPSEEIMWEKMCSQRQ